MKNLLQFDFERIVKTLAAKQPTDTELLFSMIESEQRGENRKPVVLALTRAAVGNFKGLVAKSILSAIKGAETRRRRKFVRKVYKSTSIWLMDEIREMYPDYTEDMLREDLAKPKKNRKKMSKKVWDSFRERQIRKAWDNLKDLDPADPKYNKMVNIVATNVRNYGKPIKYEVRRGDEAGWVTFPAKTKEDKIIAFLRGLPKCNDFDAVWQLHDSIMFPKFGR